MMNRIIPHHTGGGYCPNHVDFKAYHRLIDGEGKVHNGQFKITDNAPGVIRKGRYAAHTRKLNTGSIGVSVCAMLGGIWSDPFGGTHPVKPIQVDALVLELASLSSRFNIPPTRRTILTHAEVQITLGVAQRAKWDFDYSLRGGSSRDPIAIGDELRAEVALALAGMAPSPKPRERRPTVRRGSRGEHVEALQGLLGAVPDGIFGPATESLVFNYQSTRGLLPDGVVGPMTWAMLYPQIPAKD